MPSAIAWSRDVIERQVLHLTELVDDLLDISRITRGTINLQRGTAGREHDRRPGRRVDRAVARGNQHQLSVDCPCRTHVRRGRSTRARAGARQPAEQRGQVSAVPAGRIELNVRRSGAAIEFRVRDYGIGIAGDSMPKLFTLFSRLPGGSPPERSRVWVWGLRWCAGWSRCMAEAWRRTATASGRGASSWFVCRRHWRDLPSG